MDLLRSASSPSGSSSTSSSLSGSTSVASLPELDADVTDSLLGLTLSLPTEGVDGKEKTAQRVTVKGGGDFRLRSCSGSAPSLTEFAVTGRRGAGRGPQAVVEESPFESELSRRNYWSDSPSKAGKPGAQPQRHVGGGRSLPAPACLRKSSRSRRYRLKLLLLVLLTQFLLLVAYTASLRFSDARRLNAFVRLLSLPTVGHYPGVMGTAESGGKCVYSYKLSFPEDMSDPINVQNTDVISTLMVRLCGCVGHSSIEGVRSWLDYRAEDLRTMVHGYDGDGDRFLKESFAGSHVVIRGDRGGLHKWLSERRGARKRMSSHFSSSPQYGIPMGSDLRTLLTGTTSSGDTWFQFESADFSLYSPLTSSVHIINYLEYAMTGWNIGPMGASRYTESDPLIIDHDGCNAD